jgi:hypothetical protein
MPQQPLTKHDTAARFFKLVSFGPNFNWNNDLLPRTAYSVEAILNSKAGDPSSSSVFVPNTGSKPFDPEVLGPLNLLTSSTDDSFGIIEAINKREAKSRFCAKLAYEGFEVFIFVENRKLISLIIDPHQFLNAFDAKKMSELDLYFLYIDLTTQKLRELEERIQQIIESYKNRENNLSHHLLFKTINELWENDSEIDKKEEFLFDLLPTAITLFNFASLPVGSNYLDKNLQLVDFEKLFELNRYCLKTTTYLKYKSGGLFKGEAKKGYKGVNESYKNFKRNNNRLRYLLIEPKTVNIDGDKVLRAIKKLFHLKANLIKSFLDKCLENNKTSGLEPYTPRMDTFIKAFLSKKRSFKDSLFIKLLSNKIIRLNVVSIQELKNSPKQKVFFNQNYYLYGIDVNRKAFLNFIKEHVYEERTKENLLSAFVIKMNFNKYLSILLEHCFEINSKLNEERYKTSCENLSKESFANELEYLKIYYVNALREIDLTLTFPNYVQDNKSQSWSPCDFDIGVFDIHDKNIFLEKHKSLKEAEDENAEDENTKEPSEK